jgi:predicted ABC-type ATPase
MFDFNTVYKITVTDLDGAIFAGLAIGVRPLREESGDGVVRNGFEWIPNSDYWLRKHAYLRVDRVGPSGDINATSTIDEDAGYSVKYRFEPITMDNLEAEKDDISEYDRMVRTIGNDADLNEFFREDWLREDWTPNSQEIHTTESLVIALAAKELVEIEAAPMGDIRHWKSKGWMQKTRKGWVRVDGPKDSAIAVTGTVLVVGDKSFQKKQDGSWSKVDVGSRGEMPGRWKDASEGLPENSRDAHWDESKKTYSLSRKALHNDIRDSILDRVRPVDRSVSRPQAVITMGIPASGKSKAVGDMIDTSNHAHIDPDNIREQLPEFKAAVEQRAKDGGSIVKDETDNIADEVLTEAVGRDVNILLEGVVSDPDWYENDLIPHLKNSGYDVAIMMVHEPNVDAAIERADLRGRKKGRFVPERHIRDAQPRIPKNFKRLSKLLDSFAVYTTGKPPRKMWTKENGRETVHDTEAFEEFQKLMEARWFDTLLGSPLKEADDKPTELAWGDFLSIMEKAWDIDQTDVDGAPDLGTEGVEIPEADISKSKK